ncbi:iron uptake transporter deferrochelatase/peroxidase subunit [Microbacterium sp. X-17]|uniref:iron uptake transporter deferrochelatase/peroxidase subunit n=1 Tax=Microbacterium sp. X-17 TaxID=3144404 RepID=UPI0031F507B9
MSETPEDIPTSPPSGFSRRDLLGLLGAGAAGIAVGTAAGLGIAAANASSPAGTAPSGSRRYPFSGTHQSGILTPVQDRLHFAAFDMSTTATRDQLVSLLKDWSAAAALMVQGQEIGATGATGGPATLPPADTGEAIGLPASGLTITFGLGPALFDAGRFGLEGSRPQLLQALPRFRGDALLAQYTGGDLCVQACADDPQVAVHAIRNLSRIAFGRASLRWSQLGFGRTSSTSTTQVTARNLMGFKDGTANLKSEDAATADAVWVTAADDPGAAWLEGGSYLVARRIRMLIEAWDRAQLGDQENTIGRDKAQGAPLSGGTEFTAIDLSATGPSGAALVPKDAHVRLAHPTMNGGAQLLRRGYNFVDGNDDLGRLDAGLFFLSYQRSPEQFIRVQTSLSTDALNEYIKHVGSGIWAVPPGASAGGWVGETLFA